jgi:hypothetical protein
MSTVQSTTGAGDRKGMLCPSSRAKPGSELIGVRQDDGTIAILPQPLPVDESFLHIAAGHALAPEQRFRFTNKCVESGCSQWTGSRCGVIDQALTMMEEAVAKNTPQSEPAFNKQAAGMPVAAMPIAETPIAESLPAEDDLPACGIRPSCRWWRQSGPAACKACTIVITRTTETDLPTPLRTPP